MRELKIDLNIQDALRPMSPEEWAQFSKNVLADGKILEPLIVWKGKDIIVDGHHRWKAINEFGIKDYQIEEKAFDDVDDAILWLLKHQKGRRNQNDNQLNVLIGKAYERQKAKHGGTGANQYTVEQTSQVDQSAEPWTVEVVSEAYGVSPKTVQRAAQFVEVLGKIEEKTSPEVVHQLISTPDKIPTPHLAVLNGLLDENPNVIVEYQALTPYQRSKLMALVRGTEYCKLLDQRGDDGRGRDDKGHYLPIDGASVVELAARFKVSARSLTDDRDFARLVNKTTELDSDLADWIMSEKRFPIKKAGAFLVGDDGRPDHSMLKFVRNAMVARESFGEALAKWDALAGVRDADSHAIASADKAAKIVSQRFSGGCLLPNVRQWWCSDCEWGFDTIVPEPGGVSCPYCGGKNLSKRDPAWVPNQEEEEMGYEP